LTTELESVAEAAWDAYAHSRKAPHTRKAGTGYADPDYDLALDWINAADAIRAASNVHIDSAGPNRILLINGSSRSEHTCPGEMSKSYRLSELAESVFVSEGTEVDLLDLSRLTSEYGRRIHPCKACFSTSPALCHWPCSCYPNYSLGQVQDWMNEIYPLWVAKAIELSGWDYPEHLAGRLFATVVHGDAEGIRSVGHALSDWLTSMGLESAGKTAELERYIGYWKPYAGGHHDLDEDTIIQEEVRVAAQTLVEAVKVKRSGKFGTAKLKIQPLRQK
jgi:hypothetical protein